MICKCNTESSQMLSYKNQRLLQQLSLAVYYYKKCIAQSRKLQFNHYAYMTTMQFAEPIMCSIAVKSKHYWETLHEQLIVSDEVSISYLIGFSCVRHHIEFSVLCKCTCTCIICDFTLNSMQLYDILLIFKDFHVKKHQFSSIYEYCTKHT